MSSFEYGSVPPSPEETSAAEPGWAGYGAASTGYVPPYMVGFSPSSPPLPPAPVQPRRMKRWAVLSAAGLVLAGTAAFGVSELTERQVCSEIEAIGERASISKSAGDSDGGSGLLSASEAMTDKARLLLFNGGLRTSVGLLADDLEQMHRVDQAGVDRNFSEMLSILQSLDGHFKDVEKGCGLPAEGLMSKAFEATAASAAGVPVVSVKTPPAPTATTSLPPSKAPKIRTTTSPSRTAAAPAPKRTLQEVPRYIPSQADLMSAQAAVDRADERLQRTLADPNESELGRKVAAYDLEVALQRQKDLKAGQPGKYHRALVVKGTKLSLRVAEAHYKAVLASPSASPADRSQAAADVAMWRERLKRL